MPTNQKKHTRTMLLLASASHPDRPDIDRRRILREVASNGYGDPRRGEGDYEAVVRTLSELEAAGTEGYATVAGERPPTGWGRTAVILMIGVALAVSVCVCVCIRK